MASISGISPSRIWEKLDTARGETRVVRIEPAPGYDDDIRCSLQQVSLEDKPYYCAISYACGDPTDKVRITVNESDLMIVRNLAVAIRHFRQMGATQPMWFDAISINQVDNEERAQQIRLMSRIYWQAHQVCVWLGPASDSSELGMGLLGALPDRISWVEQNITTWQRARDCAIALRDILSRPWWTRLWTAQEALLGRQTGFMCGVNGFDFRDLASVNDIGVLLTYLCRLGMSNVDRQSLMEEAVNTIGALHTLRELGRKSSAASHTAQKAEIYRYILSLCRWRKATMPVDKIFGLLGLCPEFIISQMQINYDVSLLILYQNMAYCLVQNTSILSILQDAGLCYGQPDEWPSWLPDWSRPKPFSALSTEDHAWAACANTSGNFGIQDLELLVKGIKIDTIPADGLGESRDVQAMMQNSDFRSMGPFITSWAKLLDLPPPRSDQPRYMSGVSVCEAFYRTLCVDSIQIAEEHGFSERQLRAEEVQKDLDIDDWSTLADTALMDDVANPLEMSNVTPILGTNRIFRTSKGYFGNGTKHIAAGDEIFVVQGSKFPLVLRPVMEEQGSLKTYRLVEICYLHGMMYGEAWKQEFLEGLKII